MPQPIEPTKFEAKITARVAVEQKQALEAIARARELRSADVLREAVRFYLIHAGDSTRAVFLPEPTRKDRA